MEDIGHNRNPYLRALVLKKMQMTNPLPTKFITQRMKKKMPKMWGMRGYCGGYRSQGKTLPEGFSLEEDVDDESIAHKVHHPEDEEEDAKDVGDERVLWWICAPVLVPPSKAISNHNAI